MHFGGSINLKLATIIVFKYNKTIFVTGGENTK